MATRIIEETTTTPIELQVWDAKNCAEYLRQSVSHFLQVTRHSKGFPAQLRISEGGKPKWAAKAVIAWALR